MPSPPYVHLRHDVVNEDAVDTFILAVPRPRSQHETSLGSDPDGLLVGSEQTHQRDPLA